MENLAAELQGTTPTRELKPELVCIVDTLDKGILVFRSHKRSLVLPSRAFHYAKRLFERTHLRPSRKGH